MLEICRICCETTRGTDAKNLFERKHSILLHHLELLTGEWLTYAKDAPSCICNCCEQDLKVAITLRERCLKTQRLLRNGSIRALPISESIDKIKLETNVILENEHCELELCGDAYAECALDCTGEEQVDDDIKVSFHDDENFVIEEEDNLVSIIKEEEESELEEPPEPIEQISLNQEKAKEKNSFMCDQCGKHIADLANLKLHQMRHSGIKKHECETCKSKFYTAHLLKRHSLIHKSAPPSFACKHCDKTFIYNNKRLQHERSHFKERRFACDHCDKLFYSKPQLKEHEVVHTRIRKHYCELCDQHFLRKTHLMMHFRSKAHKTVERANKTVEQKNK